jgi:phage repressor protein C with HTH and peptisase S24 domain
MLLMPSLKGAKIEELLRRKGKTAAWLARQLGVKKQSVYQWIEGSEPRDDSMWARVEKVLGADPGFIEDDQRKLTPNNPESDRALMAADETLTKPEKSFLRGDMAVLPVWRGVTTGVNEECEFVQMDESDMAEVPAFLVGKDLENHCLCIAAGTSMSPRFRQGEKAIVRLDPNPPRNTIVLAESPDRKRYIKVLREKGHVMELHSINDNPMYAPVKIQEDGWKLLGSIVAILKVYETGEPNIEWDFGRPLKA